MFPSPHDWRCVNMVLDALEVRGGIAKDHPVRSFRLPKRSLMFLYHGRESRKNGQLAVALDNLMEQFDPVIDISCFKIFESRMPRKGNVQAKQAVQNLLSAEEKRERNRAKRQRAKARKRAATERALVVATKRGGAYGNPGRMSGNRRGQGQIVPVRKLGRVELQGEYGLKASLLINCEASFDYARSLINPASGPARIPTSYGRGTSVFSSTSVYDVPCADLTGTNPDAGRFTVLVQAIMGGLDRPNHFKCAIAELGVGCPAFSDTNWADPNTYVSKTKGMDPRLDRHYAIMTQQGPALLAAVPGTSLATAGGVLGLPDPVSGFPQGIQTESYGLDIVLTDVGGGLGVTSGSSVLYPPPGTYLFSLYVEGVGAINNPLTFTVTAGSTFTLLVDTATNSVSFNMVLVTIAQQANGQPGSLTIAGNGISGDNAATVVWSMTTTFTSGVENSSDTGIIKQIRPVSMVVTFSPNQAPAFSGGFVSTALLPGGNRDSFFTNTPTQEVGAYQYYESLAQMSNMAERQYNEGTSCCYFPDGPEDIDWNSVSESLLASPPAIVVSGKYIPSQAIVNQPSSIGQISVTTNYEFTTDSKLWNLVEIKGSQACIDSVLDQLCGINPCRGNPEHFVWLKRVMPKVANFFGKAWNFYDSNKEVINPLVKSMAMLAL